MLKRSRLIALLLSTAFLSASAVPAIAASASVVVSTENEYRSESENDSRYEDTVDDADVEETAETYVDDDVVFEAPAPAQVPKRSQDSIALPPVVIKPKNSNQKMAPANLPVELGSLQPAKKTPADVFVESATVGVGAMAVGAAALGAVAITRGARARREKNAEYLYSSDN